MPLSATAVAHAKPQATPYKPWDERGLYLIVVPDGLPRWRFDYRHDGKRRTMSFGIYPDVTLADARGKRDAARRLVANGEDPLAARREKPGNSAGNTNIPSGPLSPCHLSLVGIGRGLPCLGGGQIAPVLTT